MQFKFIPYENLKGIIDIKKINGNRFLFPVIFLEKSTEVIYIEEKPQHLIGIVTPSDLDGLYYSDEASPECVINRNFKFLNSYDTNKAKTFFSTYKKSHEVPIIRDGIFIGIISDGVGKSEEEWISICKVINEKLDIERNIKWYCQKIKDNLGKWSETNLLVYGNIRDSDVFKHLTSIESKELMKRKGKSNRNIYNELISNKWLNKNFFKEYDGIKLLMKRGVVVPGDMESENINIINNCRVVPSSRNQSSKRKVFMFGPCNVFGAYVSDDSTIEEYLQK